MLTKGQIIDDMGFRQTGCSLGVNIKIANAKEFYHQGADIGNHLVVVYGDYVREMKELAKIMNYEILEA